MRKLESDYAQPLPSFPFISGTYIPLKLIYVVPSSNIEERGEKARCSQNALLILEASATWSY